MSEAKQPQLDYLKREKRGFGEVRKIYSGRLESATCSHSSNDRMAGKRITEPISKFKVFKERDLRLCLQEQKPSLNFYELN